MPKKPQKLFAGMPKDFFQGNSNKNSGKEIEENFSKGIFGNVKRFFSGRTTIFFRKRVAKDIDTTRVKRIELTNKEKIRNRLETQAYFPKQPSFLSTLRRTILDYFLPYPPAPPLKDERNCFWLPPEK